MTNGIDCTAERSAGIQPEDGHCWHWRINFEQCCFCGDDTGDDEKCRGGTP